MTLRAAHGAARAFGHVLVPEVLPADELPAGVPDHARPESPADRGEAGRFARGNGTAALGGKARAGKTRLADRMGLRHLADDAAFAPYKRAAAAFRTAQCAELARTVGGGRCGPAPSSLVASAALQLAWSRYLSDVAAETGDADGAIKASRLAEASRSSLLAAHELCAREASARRQANPRGAHEAVMARILAAGAEAKPSEDALTNKRSSSEAAGWTSPTKTRELSDEINGAADAAPVVVASGDPPEGSP
jgi:hypothetical protein